MKTLLNNYSYAVFLIILSCSLALLLSFRMDALEKNEFLTITVSEGDSLWEISNQYANQHDFSNKEFVAWVKKHNQLSNDIILPGEEIKIPINEEVFSTAEYASAPGE